MKLGQISIQGEECYTGVINFIKKNVQDFYSKEVADHYFIWAESFSWWYQDSVLLCFSVRKESNNKCDIEIISGTDKRGLLKIPTEHGLLATSKFYDELRSYSKKKNWSFKDSVIKNIK